MRMPEHGAVRVGAAGSAIQQPPYSLDIEDNLLSGHQASAILDGKPVAALLTNVQGVRNAIKACDAYEQRNPSSEANAHDILMAARLGAPSRHQRYRLTSPGRQVQIGSPVG